MLVDGKGKSGDCEEGNEKGREREREDVGKVEEKRRELSRE